MDVPETDAVLTENTHESAHDSHSRTSVGEKLQKARSLASAWVLDAGTRTLRAEIDLENSEGRLRPGMYAYVDVKVAERRNALALPKSAILKQESQFYCYTIDSSGKVVRTSVVTGIQSGAEVEIKSGLEGRRVDHWNERSFFPRRSTSRSRGKDGKRSSLSSFVPARPIGFIGPERGARRTVTEGLNGSLNNIQFRYNVTLDCGE